MSDDAESRNKDALIKTGTAYLLADMMTALDRERPLCPALFFNSLLHRSGGGMMMPPEHLAEFLRESSACNPALLLKVLESSFSNFDRKDWDKWRKVVPLAADSLILALKTAEALPKFDQGEATRPWSRSSGVHNSMGPGNVGAAIANNADVAMEHNAPKPPPQLLALAVGMAKSKLLLLELPKRPVKVTVVVELQVNQQRDDRNLLRAASETVFGTSLLSSLLHDLEWLSAPPANSSNSSPLIHWNLVLADTDSSAAPTCSCAEVARTAVNTQVESVNHLAKIHVVERNNILEVLEDNSTDSSSSTGSTPKNSFGLQAKSRKLSSVDKLDDSDVVLMFQNPQFCEQATQLGHIIHRLLGNETSGGKKGSSAPPLALLAESSQLDQSPVNSVIKTMMQALLGVQTPAHRLAPGVVGFKTDFFNGLKKQWTEVVEHRRVLLKEVEELKAESSLQPQQSAPKEQSGEKKLSKKEREAQEKLEREQAALREAQAQAAPPLDMSETDLLFPIIPLARCMFFVAASSQIFAKASDGAVSTLARGLSAKTTDSSTDLLPLKSAVQVVSGTIRPVELSGAITTWDVISPEEVIQCLRILGSIAATFDTLPQNPDAAASKFTTEESPLPDSAAANDNGQQATSDVDANEGAEVSEVEKWERLLLSTGIDRNFWNYLLYDCSSFWPVTLHSGDHLAKNQGALTRAAASLTPQVVVDGIKALKE